MDSKFITTKNGGSAFTALDIPYAGNPLPRVKLKEFVHHFVFAIPHDPRLRSDTTLCARYRLAQDLMRQKVDAEDVGA